MATKRPVAENHAHDHPGGTRKAKGPSRGVSNPVDGYLAALRDDARKALTGLRETIRAAAPGAEECISYSLPAFRLDGKVLVLYGAAKSHCTFFPGSGTAVAAHEDDLRGYATSKGAIRFQPSKPLPAALVRRIIRYRIAENAGRLSRSRTRASRGRGG